MITSTIGVWSEQTRRNKEADALSSLDPKGELAHAYPSWACPAGYQWLRDPCHALRYSVTHRLLLAGYAILTNAKHFIGLVTLALPDRSIEAQAREFVASWTDRRCIRV